jgi:hypothetical protein
VSGKWTVLSTLGVLALTVGTLVVFETAVRPTSAQRQQMANVIWPVAGLLIIAIWAWFLAPRKRGK